MGKSSVAAGLAGALVHQGKRVLLIDTDTGLRSLDIILGVGEKAVYDWGDVLAGNCELEKAFLRSDNGVCLLAAPATPSFKADIEDFRDMVKRCEEYFDCIFTDAPAGIDDGLRLAACAADGGLVVSTHDAVCVRSASAAADTLEKYGVSESRLIINRFQKGKVGRGGLLNIDSVIDATSVRLIGIVPEDAAVFMSATGRRIPENSPAGRAFSRTARRLFGENVPLKLKKL